MMIATVLLLCCASLAPAQEADAGKAREFEQALQRVQTRMERGDWKAARVQLEHALEAHAGGDYVLGHLGRIELALQRCAFWEDRGELDPVELLRGEVRRFNRGTAQLELHYEEGAPHDFEQRGLALVHAVEFSGPYSIEVEGRGTATVVVCATPESSIQVSFSRTFYLGRDHPKHGKPVERKVTVLSRLRGADGREVSEEQTKEFTTPARSQDQRFEVAVSDRRVTASFGGRRVISVEKPTDLWGSLALPLGGPQGTITIEGRAEVWLDRKRDESFRAGWAEFEAGWKLAEHLPPWMREALSGSATTASSTSGASQAGREPSELPQASIRIWNETVHALDARDFDTVLARTSELIEAEPEVPGVRFLRAQALFALKRRAEAIEALEPCRERFPAFLDGMSYLARLYLVSGRFADVEATIAAAVGAGVAPGELQAIAVTASKALQGPIWSEKHTYESRHYRVSSDISKERCRQVAHELEQTHRHISSRLRAGEHEQGRKFQVFAFAGQASYLDYIEDVFEGRGEFTQGMYSTYLKQLLVLDSEPRETFEHTVRHECFHQWLDSLVDEPPIWLNEGLAEYFAAARTPQGSWRDGRLNEQRAQHLRERRGALTPLSVFLFLDPASFMRDGPDNYAQAWALVHHLRHSSVENRGRFERLMKGLLEGRPNEEVLEAVFPRSDLGRLERELADFVAGL